MNRDIMIEEVRQLKVQISSCKTRIEKYLSIGFPELAKLTYKSQEKFERRLSEVQLLLNEGSVNDGKSLQDE